MKNILNQSEQTNTISIFTDAATSPQTGIAIGAYLYLDMREMNQYIECSMEVLFKKISNKIVYKKYESKKSTWSEIKTVIDALESVQKNSEPVCKIEIYTDCQSLRDLLGKRKEKLQKNNFITRAGRVLQNADLYQELFDLAAKFQIKTFKIKGHNSKSNRLTLQEKIFSILDKLSRKRLRSVLTRP